MNNAITTVNNSVQNRKLTSLLTIFIWKFLHAVVQLNYVQLYFLWAKVLEAHVHIFNIFFNTAPNNSHCWLLVKVIKVNINNAGF